jgi:8-oxo-dGTP pyrophosphatase MutT (NUDIX family)
VSTVDEAGTPAIPAATVVLLRDTVHGIETLMLRRDTELAFGGGAWVFPGGRVDAGDYPPGRTATDAAADPDIALAAARRAAVRESREEAGLEVDEESLVWFAHWTPKQSLARRFATWFFVARAPDGAVVIDDGEIRAHQWATPRDVLRRHHAADISLLPPTWMTLSTLGDHARVDDALASLRAKAPTVYVTHVHQLGDITASTWAGDAAYDDGDLERPGLRHRLWLDPAGWRLERSD